MPLPPNLIMSLQAVHLPQSGDWQTWRQTKKLYGFQLLNCRDANQNEHHCWLRFNTNITFISTHLTDTTALSFDPNTLFIILFYLIREEGIKDLVHQLGSGCFSRSLTVLLNLCWVTNGLSSGSSPVDRKKSLCSEERSVWLGTNTRQYVERWHNEAPGRQHTTASGHAT